MDTSEKDRAIQARHHFTVVGVYPTGHGSGPHEEDASTVLARIAELERNGMRAFVVGYSHEPAPEPSPEPSEDA